jgi:hypothetical protein
MVGLKQLRLSVGRVAQIAVEQLHHEFPKVRHALDGRFRFPQGWSGFSGFSHRFMIQAADRRHVDASDAPFVCIIVPKIGCMILPMSGDINFLYREYAIYGDENKDYVRFVI